MRRKHPRWGPKKLKPLLEGAHPGAPIPAESTIGEVLRRAGASRPRRRRRKVIDTTAEPRHSIEGANDVWTADYKGWISYELLPAAGDVWGVLSGAGAPEFKDEYTAAAIEHTRAIERRLGGL